MRTSQDSSSSGMSVKVLRAAFGVACRSFFVLGVDLLEHIINNNLCVNLTRA